MLPSKLWLVLHTEKVAKSFLSKIHLVLELFEKTHLDTRKTNPTKEGPSQHYPVRFQDAL